MNLRHFAASGMMILSSYITSFADERTVIFQNGLESYNGTEDTFVMSGRPDLNTNFTNNPSGARYEFEWDGEDANGRNIALLKFKEIVGYRDNQIPPKAKLKSAVLYTTITNAAAANQSSTIYNLLVDWDQQTATYKNVFIGLTGNANPITGRHVSANGIKVFHTPSTPGQIWSANITPLVQEIVDGLPNNGFAIVPPLQSTNGFGHYSSEMAIANAEMTLTVDTSAGTFQFQEGKNGYQGLQDAWIGNNNRDFYTNFGQEGLIHIDRDSGDNVKLALIRFDDIFGSGSGKIPPGSTIQSASLRFNVQQGLTSKVYLNEILPLQTEILGVEINTLFNERTVTFENFVEDGVYPRDGLEVAAGPVAEFTPRALSTINLNVTASLKKWAAGQSINCGWLLESTSNQNFWIAAKEGENTIGPPRLVVTYEYEPTGVPNYFLY